MDGKAFIDVKDPQLMKLNDRKERIEDMCRYCSAENATKSVFVVVKPYIVMNCVNEQNIP